MWSRQDSLDFCSTPGEERRDFMDTEEYQVSALIPASPNSIYTSWMDERRHSAFSGARATVDPWVGGRITALNGQVDATHVLLEAGRRITLAWRTRDFGPSVPDSRVDISLAPAAGGTEVTIHHTQIPAGSSEAFKKTWKSSYLDPMKKFFGKPSGMRAAMAAAKKGGYLPSLLFFFPELFGNLYFRFLFILPNAPTTTLINQTCSKFN